ncbi:MAG: M24 family metallopeptidase [Actinomycetota bacterium]
MDHAGRRSRLRGPLEEPGIDALLVTRLVNVRYLTGFTGTNGQLLAGPDDAVFLTDSRYEDQSSREVPDIERKTYPSRFVEALAEACKARSITRLGFESSGVTYKSWRELDALEGVELVPTEELVERLRWIKDRDELGLIQRAQAAADDAFERVTSKLAEGVTEREVAFELEVVMRDVGADALGFPTIAAFGENAAEPHHGPGDRPLARGDIVKLDFGARVEGYHSDMTRTVSFGKPDPKLREMHELVLRAQDAGMGAVKAGAIAGDADSAARRVIDDAGYGDRFGHSLGHGIGLEVHEGPTLRRSSEDVLLEGTVVTVEPGVYIPGLGGVRIEDMVVVGKDGCRALPRTTRELTTL